MVKALPFKLSNLIFKLQSLRLGCFRALKSISCGVFLGLLSINIRGGALTLLDTVSLYELKLFL